MDYIVRCRDRTDLLEHSGRKGQKWGVVTKNVGKYYIPKGIRNKASEFKKMRKMDADELDNYLDKKRKDKDKAKATSDARKGKKLSNLSDEELESVMKRTNQEKVTYNNLKQIREHEDGKPNNKNTQDLVKSAQSFKRTADDINREYKKNPPLKKPKKQDLSSMSDEDIRKAINRKVLEQDYIDVMNSTNVSNGKVKVAAVLGAIGTAAVVGTQVVDFIATAKQLKS